MEAEQATLFDLEAGRAAGERGMELASQAERVQMWKATADAWFVGLLPGTVIQADDLTAAIGLPDPEATPASNNVVGAWFSAKSKTREIVWTGKYAPSKREARHGNMQRVWRKW